MFVRTLVLIVTTMSLMLPTGTGGTASAAPDNYTPKQGVTFNSPTGNLTVRRAIYSKIMRSINSSPRGSEIKIFSWNFLTSQGKDALLRAQKRGVRVKLLMDDRNVTEIDNPPFRQLKSGLRNGNDGRPKEKRSWARLCRKSCRGETGSAHSKFFLFSEAGNAKRVVIQGSANFTLASTNNQWNDVYTHVGNRKVWEFANRVFDEAAKDEPVRPTYAKLQRPAFQLMMFPKAGTDPVMDLLQQIKCRRAANTRNGRTVIRIAPDVIRHQRGMDLARKVRALWNNGCNVTIGYTIVGKEIGRYLRAPGPRGPVPMKHLVQDFNGDGEFDNYFHLKAMAVRGHIGDDRTGWAVLNGSANWSRLAKVSDENLGIYYWRGLVKRYQGHLEYWYRNFPGDGQNRSSTSARASLDDQLIFGSNENAVYEDGTPVTDGAYDPFASVDPD